VLLFLEAGILLLAGVFAIVLGIVLGSGNSIPFAGTTIGGQGAALIGLLYIALGGLGVYLALELGKLVSWSRTATIGLQAALIVLFMARGDFSASMVVSVGICIAVAVLLVLPSASAALEPAVATPTTESTTPQANQ